MEKGGVKRTEYICIYCTYLSTNIKKEKGKRKKERKKKEEKKRKEKEGVNMYICIYFLYNTNSSPLTRLCNSPSSLIIPWAWAWA